MSGCFLDSVVIGPCTPHGRGRNYYAERGDGLRGPVRKRSGPNRGSKGECWKDNVAEPEEMLWKMRRRFR